jgi:two-component system, NtrC family, sensor kinase
MDAPVPARLLVVEDDLIVRALLAKRLRAAGHTVETAQDGRAGVETARQYSPDLILTDWMMPEMDGPALLGALRADPILRRSYVIMLTSKDDRSDRVTGLDVGADDYLVKPWADEELLARVRAGLRVQGLQRELATAERSKALLAMAATLGHEINNPLTVLSASLQIARQQRPQGEALVAFLDRCERHTERIAQVVQSLMGLNEPQMTTYVGTRDMLDLRRGAATGPASGVLTGA